MIPLPCIICVIQNAENYKPYMFFFEIEQNIWKINAYFCILVYLGSKSSHMEKILLGNIFNWKFKQIQNAKKFVYL